MILFFVALAVAFQSAWGAINWTQKPNREFQTGTIVCSIPITGNPIFTSLQYSTTYFDTVNGIKNVYFTTGNINYYLATMDHPLQPDKKNFQYYVSSNSTTNTQLTIQVSGYLQKSIIFYLLLYYILVLDSNTMFQDCIALNTIQFQWQPNNISSVMTQLPPKYYSTNGLTVLHFLMDAKAEYLKTLENNYNNIFQLRVEHTIFGTKVNSTIMVQPYFYSNSSIFRIRYLIMIYDPTTLAAEKGQYEVASSSLEFTTYSTTSAIEQLFPLPIAISQQSALVSGLSNIKFINTQQLSFYFRALLSSPNLQIRCSPRSQIASTQFAYFASNFYNCDGPLYIINVSNQSCSDRCPDGEYFDYNNNTCQPCSQQCKTCYSINQCKTCETNNYRELKGLQCLPISGYFQSNVSMAGSCSAPCQTCSLSPLNCTQCTNPSVQILVNYTCVPCGSIFVGCDTCNETQCFLCSPTYLLINSTYCGVSCSISRCLDCSNSIPSTCLRCNGTYNLINGSCMDVCGNGIVADLQQCDDGNLQGRDGCNSQCKMEQFYTCTNMSHFLGHTYTAYCSYLHTINLTSLSIQKMVQNNSLRVVLMIEQYLQTFWKDHQNFGQHFSINNTFSNMEAHLVKQWSFDNNRILTEEARLLASPRAGSFASGQTVAVTFQYFTSLQQQNIEITLSFNRSRDPRVSSIPPQTLTLAVIPQNHHYAYFYSEDVYDKRSLLKNTLLLICLTYYLFYILSLFVGDKRIMAEGIMVAQVAFSGLVACSFLNPLQSAVTTLNVANNPYNIYFTASFRPFDDPLLPNRLRGLDLYSQYLYNLNTVLALIIIPLIFGFILFFFRFCSCFNQSKRDKLKTLSRKLFGQYIFAGLTVVGCAAACASVLQIKYGMQDLSEGMMSLIACAVVGALLFLYLILWLKLSHKFDEYNQSLIEDSKASVVFEGFYFLTGPLAGTANFMLYEITYSTAFSLGFTLILYIILFFKPIFKKTRDKVRVQFNLLTIIATQFPFLLTQLKQKQNFGHFEEIMTMGVAVFLGINLIVNLAFFIYLLVKKVNIWCCSKTKEMQKIPEKSEQDAYAPERNQEIQKMYNNNMSIPLQTIGRPQFRTNFIQEDKEDSQINEQELKFKEKVCSFLKKENEEAHQNLMARENQLKSLPLPVGKKPRFPRFRYTPDNYIVTREYDEIDQL